MAHFAALLPVIWPWFILIAAQISTVSGRHRLGFALLSAFAIAALTLDLIAPLGVLLAVAGFAGAARLSAMSGRVAAIGHAVLILWCLALGAHAMPGFHNLLLLDQVSAGPDSAPFTMYLNVDKPLVLFAVLLAYPGMTVTVAPVRQVPLVIGLMTLPALFLLGLYLGAIRPEPGLPYWWLVFALSNLFLTCLTEEAFFRGYLQSGLSSKLGPGLGVAAASILFGLAHFGGGPALIAFATILGAACGLGYYATGRIWVPVLMHFAFNAAHLTLFTYPGPA